MLRVTRHQHSLKYAHHVQLKEMRQPEWIMAKYHGTTSSYTGLAKDRARSPAVSQHLMRAHMNLWSTDLSPKNNIMFGHWATLNELHGLLGRKSHNGNNGVLRVTSYSETDLTMDQRWKGAQRNAIANLVDEPLWNTIMYPLSTLRQRSNGERNYSADVGINMTDLANLQPDGIPLEIRAAATAAAKNNNTNNKNGGAKPLLDPLETYQLMTIKTKEHVAAYWKNLSHIISVNRPAVGDLDEVFRSRSIRHAHEAFVKFQDALRSHNFQDSYLIRHLQETRPKELTDIFGVFMEMEANYVNHDFCPRCSLPYATTRYCGEGDAHTPFRKNRGRWAPHKSWGKEWYDVVVRRAEQLWYRATEDPLFGTVQHTQKQAEELLKVYCKTQNRGKAIHFMTTLRGSLEYLQGKIKITEKMQKDVDALLDETPHPHLLTNGFRAQPNGASNYLLSSVSGVPTAAAKSSTVPLSPLQFRVDMEMSKIRRDQKEQGAVRLPPQGWRINTENIVPYKLGANGKISNWRQVKEGIEKSFLDTGLPTEAYTAEELREMAYLTRHIAARDVNKAALRKAFEAERDAARKEGKLTPSAATKVAEKAIFPTAEYYQLFETTDAALAPFNQFVSGGDATATARLRYGMPITADRKQFNDARNVTLSLEQSTYTIDTTDEVCKLYGFLHGQVVTYTDAESKEARTVIVLGVEKQSSAQHQLLAVDNRGVAHSLGYDIDDVRARCLNIAVDPARPRRSPKIMGALLTSTESFAKGTVIGVRNNELYVSWDNGVAVPLGSPDVMSGCSWRIYPSAGAAFPAPREPYSWVTPFRNDWSEERLEELKKAPWGRERYVSLIQNKFTPVVKRFGYTQHITQDDFVTKEYKDRLTSKQFFTNPQAFEVIPDRSEKSVRFGGKDEVAQRLHGLPTADRAELENGWEDVADPSAAEVKAIEQSLKDISGRRPGNFIKSPTEIASLKLNENWWTPLNHGWQQEAKEQKFLENAADRKNIDGSKNPFGGAMPAFGTTYGIGERIREIAGDFSKGFGLGGSLQQSPTADNHHMNTLGFESNNVAMLGYSNIVLRLFNEKLGSNSIYTLADSLAANHRVDPRDLLLSLNEWRTAGRNPSPMLKRVLSDYLRPEIESYNRSAVKGADTIDMLGTGAAASSSGLSAGGVDRAGMITAGAASHWLDVDRDAFKTDYFLNQRNISSASGGGDEAGGGGKTADGYVISRVIEMAMRNAAGASDESLAAHCAAEISADFSLRLSESVGQGIPLAVQNKWQKERKTERMAGAALQLVRGDVLKGLLRSIGGLGDSTVATIIAGLGQTADVVPLSGDFAVPLQAVLSWKGPSGAGGSSSAASSAIPNRDGKSASAAAANTAIVRTSIADEVVAASSSSSNVATAGRFAMNPIYNLVMSANEGAALDFAYAASENMKNATLRAEFVEACRGVIKVPAFVPSASSNSEESATLFYNALYDRYCEGLWIPTFDEASQMFVAFLRRCSSDPKMLIEYFNFKGEDMLTGAPSAFRTEVANMNKKRFANIPFTFENVTIEALRAKQLAKKLNDLPPNFVFIAGNGNAAAGSAAAPAAAGDAAPAAASSSSASAAGVSGFAKKSSAAAASSAAASSSSVSANANSINTQNYFDRSDASNSAAAEAGSTFVSVLDERAVSDLSAALRKAFPLGNTNNKNNNNSNGNVTAAPPAPNSTYTGPFTSFLANGLQSMKIFRQWCDTVFPLMPSHYSTIDRFMKVQSTAVDFNTRRGDRFHNILVNESNEQLEREFRQNAERYWRKAIEGKGLEEFGAGGGGGADRQSSNGVSPQRRNVGFGGGNRGGGGAGNFNNNRSNNNNSNNANSGSSSGHGDAMRKGLNSNNNSGPASSSGNSGRGRGLGGLGGFGGRGGGGRGRSSGFRGAGRGRGGASN